LTDGRGYYAILGVPDRASDLEIKRSYRRLARKYHPDRNSSAHAEEMIKKINAAFEVLADKDSRACYDRTDFALSEPEPRRDDGAGVLQRGTAQENTFADFFDAPHFLDVPRGRFHITVEPSLCMAFGSCEVLAPRVFSVEKNKRMNPKARVECETCADYDAIHAAAATCPTKAIRILDRYTGEQLYP
jgi:DnaJ-class molecular chaperone